MAWDAATDSPLLAVADASATRARFALEWGAPAPLEPVAGLLAGAVDVDITPPPGLPKAGYSANAHDGNGFRTRLRARVLHLRAGRTSLAVVACDLLGGSAVVQHLVARAVAETTDVPLGGLLIGATHTHAGPGQFLGTDFYNRFASNRSGFDPAWTQFLVERIAGGVREAVEQRRPARLATGSCEVWGLTRNRSLAPHVHNETVADRRLEPQRKYVAVNPLLHLLRVDALDGDDGPGGPMGALVVFSVHGTGIPMAVHEYNADLWAYLVGELRRRIAADHGAAPVVGAIEGTHADVAPALRPGQAGHLEARRVGAGIGAEAYDLYRALEPRLRSDVTLAAGLREVDLERDRSIDGVTLPRRPAVGAALVAGAHENVTPVVWRIPPFRAGTRKPFGGDGPHGAKWVIGTRWLQPVVLPLRSFPRVLPVAALRVGDTMLVGLPFEITTESGRRIAAAARAAMGADAPEVVVSSVANEYAGYVATAEEYELQHYEGGHTLYGPNSQRFVAAHAAQLAAAVQSLAGAGGGTVHEPVTTRAFDLAVRRYLPRPEGADAVRRSAGPARFADPTARADATWAWHWHDVAPGDLCWHAPMVAVERSDGDGWAPARQDGEVVDDQGWRLEVAHLGPDRDAPGSHRYRVRWHGPAFRAGRRHRFVLAPNAGRPELASDPFD